MHPKHILFFQPWILQDAPEVLFPFGGPQMPARRWCLRTVIQEHSRHSFPPSPRPPSRGSAHPWNINCSFQIGGSVVAEEAVFNHPHRAERFFRALRRLGEHYLETTERKTLGAPLNTRGRASLLWSIILAIFPFACIYPPSDSALLSLHLLTWYLLFLQHTGAGAQLRRRCTFDVWHCRWECCIKGKKTKNRALHLTWLMALRYYT